MNPFAAVFNRDGRKKLALTVLYAALLSGTSALGAEQATDSNRFLFIIDTSASMKPFENAVRESMFDLIYSGVRGHMTNADTYGLWLISDQNDMSFKMETWRQRHTVEMAARAAAHVKDHGFKGKLKLSQALADVATVIKNVEDLTVILISNGESPISGTPFDDAINDRFLKLAPHMKKAKATLNTTLIARNGQIVAWAVNSPDFLIEVPYVAPTPKRAKPEVVATESNAPAPAAITVAPTVVAQQSRPRVVAPSIIITKDTVAQERRQFLAMTSTATNEPVAAPAVTNSIATAAPAVVTNAVAAVAATNISEPKPVVVPTNAIVQRLVAAPTNAPAPNAVAVTKSEATNLALVTPPATPALPASATKVALVDATPATQGTHPMLWAGLGAGAAFTCVLAILFFCRSRRQEPSLISQSLVRERAHVN